MSAPQREDRTRLDGLEVEIFKLVAEGATSEQWREWLRAPLEHAAAKGNMDLFTRLMDAGADGSAGWRGCHGRTLLGAAAFGKKEPMVIALLEAGAKPDVDVKFGASGKTALHVAAAQGAKGACTSLMLAGANPNMLDKAKHSPLHVAASEGHDGVVDMLLLKGAHPDAKTRSTGRTALHFASSKGHVSCVSSLVRGGANKDVANSTGQTPLYQAAGGNHVGAALKLLAAGATVDIRAGGKSPLEAAASRGYVDVLRAILRYGGDSNACNDSGITALHMAASVHDRDNGGVIHALVEAGADIEAKTTGQLCHTPLHAACRGAPKETVQALLELGANVHARDRQVRTPLHRACLSSSVGAVELLLRWGADEKLVDNDGKTAGDLLDFWGAGSEERQADDERVRHMLARAPADRSWRRRGWLVLARSIPAKAHFAIDSSSDSDGSSAKVAKTSGNDSSGSSSAGGTGDDTIEIRRLLGRVIGLDADGVFRLVVGFL